MEDSLGFKMAVTIALSTVKALDVNPTIKELSDITDSLLPLTERSFITTDISLNDRITRNIIQEVLKPLNVLYSEGELDNIVKALKPLVERSTKL